LSFRKAKAKGGLRLFGFPEILLVRSGITFLSYTDERPSSGEQNKDKMQAATDRGRTAQHPE